MGHSPMGISRCPGGLRVFRRPDAAEDQFPGLQRTANGSTGANQFLGQIETGYRIGLFAPAAASITPLHACGLEGDAECPLGMGRQLVEPQRGAADDQLAPAVFGADLAGVIPFGSERSIALDLRLGWLHEYADAGRPITAAFAGAPSKPLPSMARPRSATRR